MQGKRNDREDRNMEMGLWEDRQPHLKALIESLSLPLPDPLSRPFAFHHIFGPIFDVFKELSVSKRGDNFVAIIRQ